MGPLTSIVGFFVFDLAVGALYKFFGEFSDYPYLQDLYKYEKGEIFWFQVKKSDVELNKQLDECKRVSEKSSAFKKMLCSIESYKKITYHNGVEAVKKTFCCFYDNQTWISLLIFAIAILILFYMIDWRLDCVRGMRGLEERKKESVMAHGSLVDLRFSSDRIKMNQKGVMEEEELKEREKMRESQKLKEREEIREREELKEEDEYRKKGEEEDYLRGKNLLLDEEEKCSPMRNPVGMTNRVSSGQDSGTPVEWKISSEHF